MPSKYEVWLVDDREENRTNFKQRHSAEWDVKTFERPDDVLTALSRGPLPDALVCDIYFYDDPVKREAIEELVQTKAQELKAMASRFDPKKAQKGIGLIENVHAKFGGRPKFPVFAYTSKGAFLLHDEAYSRLEAASAHWLFKGKYSAQQERSVVNRVIRELEARGLSSRLRPLVIATGIISAVVGALFGVFFAHLWWGW